MDPMSCITFAPVVGGPTKREGDGDQSPAKRHRNIGDFKFRFIRPPTLLGAIWTWPHLHVKKAGKKGKGVFAKEDIPRGLLIPYNGELWTNAEYEDGKRSVREKAYALDCQLNGIDLNESNVGVHTVVLADPTSHTCRSQFCIAGMVNEASAGVPTELYNAQFVDLPFGHTVHMPRYGAFVRGLSSFILTTTDIKKDEEILCWYGPIYDRGGAYLPKNRTEENIANNVMDEDTRARFRHLNSGDCIRVEGAPEAAVKVFRYVYKTKDIERTARAVGMDAKLFRKYMKQSYLYDLQDRRAKSGVKMEMQKLKMFQSVWAYLPDGDTCTWMGGIVIGKTNQGHAVVFILNNQTKITITQSDLDTMPTIDKEAQYLWQGMVDNKGKTDGVAFTE